MGAIAHNICSFLLKSKGGDYTEFVHQRIEVSVFSLEFYIPCMGSIEWKGSLPLLYYREKEIRNVLGSDSERCKNLRKKVQFFINVR